MEGFPCPQCNRGDIERRPGPHRRMAYRHISDLELPPTLELPTCSACGELWLDAKTTRRVQEALEAEYRRQLTLKAERALDTLQPHLPQRELERLLGVSAGWLSKVKNGREPSAPMTAVLMLLAEQPERVEELRRLWSAHPALRASKPKRRGAPPTPALKNGSRSR